MELKLVRQILACVEDISETRIVETLNTGYFRSVLSSGGISQVVADYERENIRNVLAMVSKLGKRDEISVTVSHEGNEHGRRQLRCWFGEHGYISRGHVDSGSADGVLLFQMYVKLPLQRGADPFRSDDVCRALRYEGPKEWVRVTTKYGSDGGACDFLVPKKGCDWSNHHDIYLVGV